MPKKKQKEENLMPHRQWRFRNFELVRHRSNDEAQLQHLLVNWLESKDILFVASNVGGMNLGARVGAIRKRLGVRAGVPDLLILEPRGKYHGMALELKVKGGKISDEQTQFTQRLTDKGYYAVIMPPTMGVSDGLAWAQNAVEEYLAKD